MYRQGAISFVAPFVMDLFNDVALFKLSGDSGGGSFKFLINMANAKNPQGLEHVHIFLEFSGVKDTHENVMTAAFCRWSPICDEFEDLCNRRCIIIGMEHNEQSQLVIIKNTYDSHNSQEPESLTLSLFITKE